MTNRERENATLSFLKPEDRGAVEETFHPWNLTIKRFEGEGLPSTIGNGIVYRNNNRKLQENIFEKYLDASWGEGVLQYEKHLGFDPVRRISFILPFMNSDEQDAFVKDYKHTIKCEDDWKKLKEHGNRELEKYYTPENIQMVYGPLKEGHERGDYSIRLNIEGFFWTPRELMGIESHMYALYDQPELLHDINDFILEIYLEKLTPCHF